MKNFLHSIILTTFCFISLQLLAIDETSIEESSPIKIELVSEKEWIEPGKPFSLLLSFDIDDNWHTYWKNPGDSGMPAIIDWRLPEGFKVTNTHWQAPTRFTLDETVGFGYEDEMHLLVDLEAPAHLNENDPINIEADISWLACSDMMCLPGNSLVSTLLPVKKEAASIKNSLENLRNTLPKEEWELTAYVTPNGHIELKILTPKDQTVLYKASYFCPEESAFIDHKSITHFDHKEHDLQKEDFHYTLNLKRIDEEDNLHGQPLKGILTLLHEKDGETVQKSVAVNIPIQHPITTETDEIAAITPSDLKKNFEFQDTDTSSEFEGGFFAALAFAFIGGMLLNLMPCVLPVLSLKIFSFIKMSNENRSLTFKHGLIFSLGVLISFWVLAGVLLILQAYGEAVGWGFQLQEPIFVAILASIIFILGLNLFGVMELGTSITNMAAKASHKKEGLSSSFFSGVLATAIATPCTGPFLGSAVGYAVTLPSYLALMIFTMLGFGMAFPYLLLSAYPNLLKFIPKPGNWMITFKEVMGFFMMATVLWLLWVFGAETSSISVIFLLGAFLLFGIACWIYGKWGTPIQSKLKRSISYLTALCFFSIGGYLILTALSPAITSIKENVTDEIATAWEPFSTERIKELQAKGIPVFVDFTAKWCLICQTNHMVLDSNDASSKFDNKKVVRMKADWTKSDPLITAELRKFGRNSVPLYVLYDNESKPKVLPQVLTSDIVRNYLDELK